MAYWCTKEEISEMRKDRGTVTMDGLNSPTLFRTVRVIPDPLRPHFLQDWGFAIFTQKCRANKMLIEK